MRAVVVRELGGPDVLSCVEIDEPRPASNEVVVRVGYAGINFADVKARSHGPRAGSVPFVPGLEASGVVASVGSDVRGFEVGERVTALSLTGAYAEFVKANELLTFHVPDTVTLRTAATLPTVLPTSFGLVHRVGDVRPGTRLLVHGAAGAVGLVVAQLARQASARAILGVVSRADKVPAAVAAGYDSVFVGPNFSDAVFEATDREGVDVVFDPVGGSVTNASMALLARFGRLVSYGNASNESPARIELDSLCRRDVGVFGFSVGWLAQSDPFAYRQLANDALASAWNGGIVLPITGEFALQDVADAHRLLEGRTTTGKLVVKVSEQT